MKKGEKMVQDSKKLSLLCSISQEPYMIVILPRLKNDNILRHFLNVLKFIIFEVVSGVKGQKMVQND